MKTKAKKRMPVERWILPLLSGIVLLATIIAGLVLRSRIPDCGLAGVDRMEEIPTEGVKLRYAYGAGDPPLAQDYILGDEFGATGDINDISTAPIVARVRPTGRVRFAASSRGQEVEVKEVFRGGEFLSEGQCCYVYQFFGLEPSEGIIYYWDTINLMNPDYEYLIFLEPSPLNEYGQDPAYIMYGLELAYIRIGGQETKTLEEDYQSYEFMELQDYEFFSVSEEITEKLNQVQRDILQEYGL